MIIVSSNLDSLNKAVLQYKILSNKTWPEVMSKKGGDFARLIRNNLFSLAPQKGEIRRSVLERLRSGRGIRIRSAVRKEVGERRAKKGARRSGGRTLNIQQEIIRREIAVREMGTKFMGVSSRFPSSIGTSDRSTSRTGHTLARAGVSIGRNQYEHVTRFTWNPNEGGHAGHAARAMQEPGMRDAVEKAAVATRSDIQLYIKRKQDQAARKAFAIGGRAFKMI